MAVNRPGGSECSVYGDCGHASCAVMAHPDSVLIMGTGPRHDRTGTEYAKAVIGDKRGRYADLEVMTWTGCNGQMCGGDCGPGHHVRLWVSCRFAVGDGHWMTLTDEEIASLRDVLGKVES